MSLKSKSKQLKVVNIKLDKIQAQYPDVNFLDNNLRHAFERHFELMREFVYLTVDIKCCQDQDKKKEV